MRSKKFFVVILGFVLSFGAAILLCNPNTVSEQIPPSKLVRYGYGWEHIGETNKTIRLLEDKVCIKYFIHTEGNWNYREFYISNLKGSQQVEANVRYLDKQGNHLIETVEKWGNGTNLIQSPVADFHSIQIRFYQQKGVSFTLEGLRMMETFPRVAKKKTIFCSIIFFCFYLILVWLFRKYLSLETFFQEVRFCERDLFEAFRSKKPKKTSGVIRAFLWGCIILTVFFTKHQIQAGSGNLIRYLELAILLLLLFLGSLYGRKEKKPFPVEGWISYLWTTMCVWFLVSDFFVRKPCQFVGLILLFGMGYLIYHVTETGSMECLFQEFILGFCAAFFISAGAGLYLESIDAWAIARPHGIYELLSIWKGYLMNLNLLGHNTMLFWGGRVVPPYNGILHIGYTYGVAAIACYISIWLWIFYQGKRYFWKKGGFKKVWFGGIVFIFLCSMVMDLL